ncbi:MAG: hypothetical protein IJS19_02990 [Muribaculaceae bacterium]|nr:hypothetical protein [Muribaculaceae bacterium]
MKVLPINYTDDIERWMRENNGENAVGIEELSVTYIQPADTNSTSDEVQTIKLTSRCASAVGLDDFHDTADGFYVDIEIPEGGHWSVNDGDDMKAIIDDFYRRLNMIGK